MEFLKLFIGTFVLRWYVLLFLLAYLVIAPRDIGWRRMILFMILGFGIAFAAEASSIRNGFPFGWYFYLPEATVDRELWIAGVPFMDSLSFVFLNYAAFALAGILRPRAGVFGRALGSAALVMLLDVVIDPVALRGSRWFLGQIFYYPYGGGYFGVPLANFGGWFLVGFVTALLYQLIERRLFSPVLRLATHDSRFAILAPCALYFGILAFNITMTFWIGEIRMGLTSTGIAFIPMLLLATKRIRNNQ
ncbi:MAG: carotenoid biosynthesis protein [Planctomycetota bacterium]